MPDVPERFANHRDNRRFVEREFSSRAKVTDQDARYDPRFDFSRKSMCQAPGKDATKKQKAVSRGYDAAGNMIETHEHAGESSTYTRFGSTLPITGERNVP